MSQAIQTEIFQKRILRRKDVAQLLGLSVFSVDRWTKAGKLPKPISLGARFCGWDRESFEQWYKSVFLSQNDSIHAI